MEWANSIKDFMVPGWLTWIDSPDQIQAVKDGQRYSVHPEHNKWGVNFPADLFETLGPLNLDEVLKL